MDVPSPKRKRNGDTYSQMRKIKITFHISYLLLSFIINTYIFFFSSLQEGQDIFGVDFDYEEFEKMDEDEYEDEEEDEDYDDTETGERVRRPKKTPKKKPAKSIFEIYEPSELKRGHFTDFDNEVMIIKIIIEIFNI